MSSEIHKLVFRVANRTAATEPVPEEEELDAHAPIEVNVIFTTEKHASTALKFAGALAQNLNAELNLIAVKEVPLGFPLDRPPVAIPFTQQRLYNLASKGMQGSLNTTVRLYYCRDRLQGLLRVLKPKSLVILSGGKRLWPTQEGRLGKVLRAGGHQVIFSAD